MRFTKRIKLYDSVIHIRITIVLHIKASLALLNIFLSQKISPSVVYYSLKEVIPWVPPPQGASVVMSWHHFYHHHFLKGRWGFLLINGSRLWQISQINLNNFLIRCLQQMLLDCENEMRELETIHFLLNCLFSSFTGKQ